MRGIQPNWPAPTWVRAISTTRLDGVSQGCYNSLNLGYHVKDSPSHVALNRLRLAQQFNFMYEPMWLNQKHTTKVIEIKTPPQGDPLVDGEKGYLAEQADGAFTQLTGVPCAVLTADCLPVLLCDTQGTLVAALHCGWRGLAGGIIENTLNTIRLKANGEILAWLGPAIGPNCFEVGDDVRDVFLKDSFKSANAFKPTSKPGKWMGDLYQLASLRLRDMGVKDIYGGDYCTYTDDKHFFSYRRDKETGRMATIIWLAL
ncbi:MAG: peptidoglycan editing factor PgeF [Proteobacteria bacterium]|nr:peptidoglycan editing factor PgeF [Pseudomonadota bacterium]